MADQQWPGDWLRGVLDMAVLGVLTRGPSHGYSVTRALQTAGLGEIKGGSLYPVLARLETAGLLTARWEAGAGGPGRKVVQLTDAGAAALDRRRTEWHEFTAALDAVLDCEKDDDATGAAGRATGSGGEQA